MKAILETRGLTKTFGAVTAAANLSVRVEEGTILGLIGGNGAGKTTFLNLVTGYLRPTSGTVHFDGREVTGMKPRQLTRLGVCRSFQIPQVFDSLSVHDNLLVGLGIVKLGRRAFVGSALGDESPEHVAEDMLARFRLEAYRHAPAGTLPEGVRKLLDIAMALAVKPRLLLLDEPTSGVSAEEKFSLMDLVLGAIRAERVTVLFVEHDMDIVRRYTERVLAFYDGKIIADGPSAAVLENGDVRRFIVGDAASPAAGDAAASTAQEGSC
jgi:branched-chain amino acid transport system ATP-binding protein